jgi:hypothetical protein
MENINIPRSEILKLSSSMLNDISPHSLGQWLKSKTGDQYIIIPKSAILEIEDQLGNLNIWL